MIFTNKTDRKGLVPLMLGAKEIKIVPHTKYLGVYFDSKLNWTEHITQKINAGKRTLHMLRNTLSATWGLKPGMMHWVYMSIIRPMVTYAAGLWSTKLGPKQQQQLITFQRFCLTKLGNFRHGSPAEGLNTITATEPMNIWFEEQQLLTHMRLTFHNKDKLTPYPGTYQDIRQSRFSELDIDPARIDTTPKQRVWERDYNFNYESVTNPPTPHYQLDNIISCYTDGSQKGDKLGAGVIIYNGKSKEPPQAWAYQGHKENNIHQNQSHPASR